MVITNKDLIAQLPPDSQERIRQAVKKELEQYKKEGLLEDLNIDINKLDI